MKDFFKNLFKSIAFDLALALVLIIAIGLYFFITGDVFAESYTPLAQLPGLPTQGAPSIGVYVDTIFKISIGLGAILAVLMITIGGLQYMGSDAFNTKGVAKERITNALLGLGLLLISSLILGTINSDLLNLDIELERAESSLEASEDTNSLNTENISQFLDQELAAHAELIRDNWSIGDCETGNQARFNASEQGNITTGFAVNRIEDNKVEAVSVLTAAGQSCENNRLQWVRENTEVVYHSRCVFVQRSFFASGITGNGNHITSCVFKKDK